MTLHFTLSKKACKGAVGNEILIRFSLKRGVVYRVKSGVYIPATYWDDKKCQIKIPRIHTVEHKKLILAKSKLEQLTLYIEEKCLEVVEKDISKSWLENTIYEFHNGTQEAATPASFEDIFNEFIKMNGKSQYQKKNLSCVLRTLKRFEMYYGNNYRLEINSITDKDLAYFEDFLKIEHTFFNKKKQCIKHKEIYEAFPKTRIPQARGGNGIFSIMKLFRTFYNWAVNTGRTSNNPFKKFKLNKPVYGSPLFMTLNEINQLYHFDLSSRSALATQRDIFVFQSLVGMRVGDFFGLTRENLVNGAIEYIPSKTCNKSGKTVRVPLCKQATEILSKYKDYKGKTLLPFISQQKYNVAIKKVLRLANITRVVTRLNPTTREEEQCPICDLASSHMARRNFVGNLYYKVQDPNAIGAMTGHSEGSMAFARYRKIDDSIKKDLVAWFDQN